MADCIFDQPYCIFIVHSPTLNGQPADLKNALCIVAKASPSSFATAAELPARQNTEFPDHL